MVGRSGRTAGLAWALQRLSALLLVAGLVVHFLVLHFTIERPVTFVKVQARLASPAWIAFDLALLALVLYHGLNGVYGVVLDYAPGATAKRGWYWVLWVLGIVAFALGVVVLAPFGRR